MVERRAVGIEASRLRQVDDDDAAVRRFFARFLGVTRGARQGTGRVQRQLQRNGRPRAARAIAIVPAGLTVALMPAGRVSCAGAFHRWPLRCFQVPMRRSPITIALHRRRGKVSSFCRLRTGFGDRTPSPCCGASKARRVILVRGRPPKVGRWLNRFSDGRRCALATGARRELLVEVAQEVVGVGPLLHGLVAGPVVDRPEGRLVVVVARDQGLDAAQLAGLLL